jgi:Domain of Unknown Function with PDB structure (DUF3857)/Transglutaminase-like superfamily
VRLCCGLMVLLTPQNSAMRLIMFLLFLPSLAWAAYVPPYTIVNYAFDFDVRVDGSYTRTMERMTRIDTPQGIDQYGQAKIYYDSKRNKLDLIDAYTLKPNGQKVSVSPERIKRLSAHTNEVAPYFSDEMMMVIIFPQVEVGSQLFYKAVLEEHDPIIKGRFGVNIPFTPHRRYNNASIKLSHPADMAIQAYARDVDGTKVVLPDGRIQYQYQFKQDTAYPLEPDQVVYEDFAPLIQFSNYPNYAELAQVTYGLYASKTKVTANIQRLADEITAGATDPRQKAQRLYDWVSKNIRYVGIDVGASGFEPHYADEILEHRYGDCKDHAVILESLLLAAGIPSSPVLINTDQSYKLPNLAGKYYFNHVITYAPELDLFLDSTAQFAEFGVLPTSDMGKPTLILQTGEIKRTPKTDPKHDYTEVHTKLELLKDGSIEGETRYIPHGQFSVGSRNNQFSYQYRDNQEIIDAILARYQETGTGEIDHPDPIDLSNKWIVKSAYQLEPVINLPGPSAFTVPVGIAPGFIKGIATIKPYEKRRYPYVCESFRHIETYSIRMPKNVSVERIPHAHQTEFADQQYKSSYKIEGNVVKVRREVLVDQESEVCLPDSNSAEIERYFLGNIKSDLRQQIFVR